MLKTTHDRGFRSLNTAYNQVFKANRLSLGLVLPIENYGMNPVPSMTMHLERVRLAERLGFAAIWLRDVPFNVPSFGDAGQCFDPFVYLGYLAAATDRIALGVASIILPLRHPAHVAKAAASADVLSGGRMLLGIASGDRPEEFPALNVPFTDRGAAFRESYDYIRRMGEHAPSFENRFGTPGGDIDMLPKPVAGQLPMLVTGGSQQDPDWIAQNADGWMTYPRNIRQQAEAIEAYRARIEASCEPDKPVMQPLYVDLQDNPDAPARPIHLGFSAGIHALRAYLKSVEAVGVNHVGLNLRFNQADTETTLKRLADELLPDFQS
ncbi:LLM class oxidoreductase [Labrenzia sp. PHM005]|uniref:LLM class oxidoreductase n=1 Tax=Labrenzia sp. PHM005 TaxID=2590016 RepID=UPI00114090E5|nr:LLM class oxidoreductase [Labrenzia sp. PHM005]QDG75167.1 LLM class oxidoreductase [Labrenzia sp. PHM005]